MASIFYLDYELGNDTTTATPLGWWSCAYTGGSVIAPVADEAISGASQHAHLTICTISSGTFAGNNAAGTMYFYGKSGNLTAGETVTWPGGGHAEITADLAYCAWKTITSGATAARIAPGDTIRIAKSPVPTALAGTTATWTDLSKTITLNTAETATIELCEADWTAVNATSSAKIGTDWKEGTYALKLVNDATPTADEVSCYQDLYTHDTTVHNLSGYQKISFWIKNEVAILANQWEINLCSNANGTGDVDTFPIPAIPSTGQWVPLTIARVGGGNLGSAIKSINVSLGNAGTVATASKYIYIDNIIACTTSGLNLQSLISKNSLEQGGTEAWFPIQSIVGTTVLIDNGVNAKANEGRGYSGASGSANTYIRETIKTTMVASGSVQTIQEDGSYGLNESYQGGYNTSNNTQEGETFFDGLNCKGNGLNNGKRFITMNRINMVRYDYGHYIYGGGLTDYGLQYDSVAACGCESAGFYISAVSSTISIWFANNNKMYGVYMNGTGHNLKMIGCGEFNNNGLADSVYSGIYFTSGVAGLFCEVARLKNNRSYGVYAGTNGVFNSKIYNADIRDNGTGAGRVDDQSKLDFYNCLASTGSGVSIGNTVDGDGIVKSHNHDRTAGNYYMRNVQGEIQSDTTTRHTASGISWKMGIFSSTTKLFNPLILPIAKIACVANAEVTIKAWFKKSHATYIGAKLVCRYGQIAGISSDVIATKADDTDWEELTITFTPTEYGVVEIEAWAYYITSGAYVYVDDLTITQA